MSKISQRELKDLYRFQIDNGFKFDRNKYGRLLVKLYLNNHVPIKEEEYALKIIKRFDPSKYDETYDMFHNRRIKKWKIKIKKEYGVIILKDIHTIIFNFI